MIWKKIEDITNIQIDLGHNIISGTRLENIGAVKAQWVDSFIVAIAWNIWKARCNFIFKRIQLDPLWLATSSIDNTKEYSKDAKQWRKKFFFDCFNTYFSESYLLIDIS